MATRTNGHFENLPRTGTIVTLLDRQSKTTRHAIVQSRVKRNGKLRLAFLGSNGKINYTVAVPNGSAWAQDKSIRYRWSYSPITSPQYKEELSSSQPSKSTGKSRKVADVHPINGPGTGPTARA